MRDVIKGGKIALRHIWQQGPRDAVFQFAEMVSDTPIMPTYLYVDLTVDTVGDMMTQRPDDFAVSTYQRNPPVKIFNRGHRISTLKDVLVCSPWENGSRKI